MRENEAFAAIGKWGVTVSEIGRRRREVVARLFAVDGRPKPDLGDGPPLNSADVAALFRMSERAIRVWAARGELPHMRTFGGGRLLYPADEIAALYAQRYSARAASKQDVKGGRGSTWKHRP